MSWCNIKAISIFLSLEESLFQHPRLLLIWKHLPHVGGRVKQGILLPQYLELFLDAPFIFTLWDVLSGEFGKELNSGVQLNDFFTCKHCSLHLTLKSVLALQVTYSFSHLLVWGGQNFKISKLGTPQLWHKCRHVPPSFSVFFESFLYIQERNPQWVPNTPSMSLFMTQ